MRCQCASDFGPFFESLPRCSAPATYARLNPAAHSARALLRVWRLGLQGAVLQGGTQAVWAGVAQLVEHLICNQRVGGSNPFVSSITPARTKAFHPQEQYRKTDLVVLPAVLATQTSGHSFKAGLPADSQLESKHGLDRQDRRLNAFKPGAVSRSAQVAEWLMAADCKSAALCATEVRILPCAPYFLP